MGLSHDDIQQAHDEGYMEGTRAAWARMLQEAVRQLGYPSSSPENWLIEREAVIAILREACRDFGDNDWPEDGHLADVIENNLLSHLYRNQRQRN